MQDKYTFVFVDVTLTSFKVVCIRTFYYNLIQYFIISWMHFWPPPIRFSSFRKHSHYFYCYLFLHQPSKTGFKTLERYKDINDKR